jgi:hypothetical protein
LLLVELEILLNCPSSWRKRLIHTTPPALGLAAARDGRDGDGSSVISSAR